MAKTTYVWDELSDNVIEEYEDGVLSVSYDHEPGLYGNLLSQNRNGVTSYYHYDGRGDTVALTDESGNVTDTKEYDAWGNVIASTGSTVTPYQFIGRSGYHTGNTGVYVRARIYQATAARWGSFDPLLFFDTPNLYSYAFNSPLSHFDFSGLLSHEEISPVVENCGKFLWNTNWILAENEQDGVILQKVCLRRVVDPCPETDPKACISDSIKPKDCKNSVYCPGQSKPTDILPISEDFCYWEGWRVFNGNVLAAAVNLNRKSPITNPVAGLKPHDGFGNSGCTNFDVACQKGSLLQTGTGYFIPASSFGEPVGKSTIRRMLGGFKDGYGNGVANACALNSMCHDKSSPEGHQIRAFETVAPSLGIRSQVKKSISLAWDCCGIGCPICIPKEPSETTHSIEAIAP